MVGNDSAQYGEKTMQMLSGTEIFDMRFFDEETPGEPLGSLFSYNPMEKPLSLHYHNFFELGYCEYGSGVFIVDGNMIPYDGRACSIIYPGQVHIAQSSDPENCLWHFLYLDLQHLFPASAQDFTAAPSIPDYQHVSYPPLFPYGDDPEMYELVKLILLEAAHERPDRFPTLRRLVDALLIRHGSCIGSDVLARTPVRPRYPEINKVINYISTHYAEDLDIALLASVARISRPSLQRKFLASTGMTPLCFLHHMRLNLATLMLRNESSSVLQIAMEVGYNSLSSFNRQFRKAYGISPSAWRKQQRD